MYVSSGVSDLTFAFQAWAKWGSERQIHSTSYLRPDAITRAEPVLRKTRQLLMSDAQVFSISLTTASGIGM